MDIVVTGSIAYDYLMTFPGRFVEHILPEQLHHVSLSFLVDEMRRQHGGVAANIAYNLALLGERPRLMGTVGQDFSESPVTNRTCSPPRSSSLLTRMATRSPVFTPARWPARETFRSTTWMPSR
jgi:sugar/nucleoside kinase (ribokinase family)